MWFQLAGDERLGRCTTENCGGQPIWRLEADGIGSNYCSGCREDRSVMDTLTAVADWLDAYYYGTVDREVVITDASALVGYLRERDMRIVKFTQRKAEPFAYSDAD